MTKRQKNIIKKPELVLIDFDGVISKNSVQLNIESAYKFINQYTPIPYEAILGYVKSTISFSMEHTISFLLSSLGIEDKFLGFKQEQAFTKLYDNNLISIENDFYQFLDFCNQNSIRYLVYSSADKEVKRLSTVIDRIGDDSIFNLKGRSKANYNTYLETAEELGINLKKCVYIDDTPLALRTGKLHGMTTVMMINDDFTIKDYKIFSSYIDYKINSFIELLEIFKNNIGLCQ
ncbi:MAG: HAD family phosphatase [Firmicutes bacterium]|nr:HAD family phosphatase [Bacillota bacterium]